MRKSAIALLAASFTLAASAALADECAGMKVMVGTEGAYPPFNSIDSSGELVGFDIDIANALCDTAGFECEFVVQDWDGIIPGLIAKKYDAIIASMSITPERAEKVDFTNKYYNTPGKFIAPKGAYPNFSEDQVKGKTVGVQRATTHENFLRDNFPEVNVQVYATQDEANLDLVAGRVDLVMADSVALSEGFLKTEEGAGFEFVGPEYSEPKWHGPGAGIAVRKGEDKLRQCLNDAIAEIRANGTYKKINDKYFDFDAYGGESS